MRARPSQSLFSLEGLIKHESDRITSEKTPNHKIATYLLADHHRVPQLQRRRDPAQRFPASADAPDRHLAEPEQAAGQALVHVDGLDLRYVPLLRLAGN